MSLTSLLVLIKKTGKRFSEKSLTFDYGLSYEEAKELINIGLDFKMIEEFQVVDCNCGKESRVEKNSCSNCQKEVNQEESDVYTYYRGIN